jgi:hypothetical protein
MLFINESFLKLTPKGSIVMNNIMSLINNYEILRCKSHVKKLTEEELNDLIILNKLKINEQNSRKIIFNTNIDF